MGIGEMVILVLILALFAWVFYDKTSGGTALVDPVRSPGSAAPAPSEVQAWQPVARRAASRYGLPWQIVLAQIWQESGGNSNAYGSAGEIGLMQLKKIAVNDVRLSGYGDFNEWATDPEVNVLAGAAYLDLQRKRTGNLADALGAYNQGFKGAKDNPELAKKYTLQVLDKAEILGF